MELVVKLRQLKNKQTINTVDLMRKTNSLSRASFQHVVRFPHWSVLLQLDAHVQWQLVKNTKYIFTIFLRMGLIRETKQVIELLHSLRVH